MRKLAFLIPLLFILPSFASADNNFSACDNTTINAVSSFSPANPLVKCYGVTLTQDLTMTGFQLTGIGSDNGSDVLYNAGTGNTAIYYKSVNGTDTSCHQVVPPAPFGSPVSDPFNVGLSVNITFLSGTVQPQINLYRTSACNTSFGTLIQGTAWTFTANALQSENPHIFYFLPLPPNSNSFNDNISAAYSVYNDTVGTSIGSTTQWATSNLLSLFLGSGLALLYYLRSWIVALIIIAAIVYFAYLAFRFFRH